MPRIPTILTLLLTAFVPQIAARAGEPSSPAAQLQIVVSVAEQKLAVVRDGEVLKKYPVSTSRFGVGDSYGSYRTPLGQLKVTDKIGTGLAAGAVIRHRQPTGEILSPNAPGRDPIVSRILWLSGEEACNRNAYERCVYIHGTPDEKHLGRPMSFGCIRMRSTDVIELYAETPLGTSVSIVSGRLPSDSSNSPFQALFGFADLLRGAKAP